MNRAELLAELNAAVEELFAAVDATTHGWTVDPHDSTPNTLAVEDAADHIEQLLGE
ncbi:hypothetical protein [Agromyces sp. CF514]|uniref:hypothetical protein n=1 Tax=Agromyces sp. CF514 TaxID=1881031 RepID=UPI0015A6DE6E|nr:hypothetical protein [Agromyces sp. CF514]